MINEYKNFVNSSAHFENKRIQVGSEYKHQNILSLESFELANKEISSWDKYEPTPLYYLSDLANYAGVSSIAYKDENLRFSLKSFKALGGAYAVANLLIKKLKEIGVKPEIEAFDLGNMWFGSQLYKEGLLSDPPMFQLCLGIPWGAPATPLAMQAMIDIMPKEAIWSGFAISKNEMPYVAQTVVMGGNPRVGLEDNLYLSKGKLATNAQLVEKAIRIINDLGATTLTPAETREKLKLVKHK